MTSEFSGVVILDYRFHSLTVVVVGWDSVLLFVEDIIFLATAVPVATSSFITLLHNMFTSFQKIYWRSSYIEPSLHNLTLRLY